jgi:hypothetical protein
MNIFAGQKFGCPDQTEKGLFGSISAYKNNRMFFTRFLLAKSGYFVR